MYYTHNKSNKVSRSVGSFKKVGLSLAILAAGSFATTLPGMVSAKGGNAGTGTVVSPTPAVDTTACNIQSSILNYNASFFGGTIRARVTPKFIISGLNACATKVNVRFVSITTAYSIEPTTGQLALASLPGYPVTEVSKSVTIQPGAFTITNPIADKPVDGSYQMYTEVRMYTASSIDANGNVLPDAVALGSDVAMWMQTNAILI